MDYKEEITYLRSRADYYKKLEFLTLSNDFNKAADCLENLLKELETKT